MVRSKNFEAQTDFMNILSTQFFKSNHNYSQLIYGQTWNCVRNHNFRPIYGVLAIASFQLKILSPVKFEFWVQTRTRIFLSLSLIPKLKTQNNFEFWPSDQ